MGPKKVYLVVIFVGLLVVIILAIMLSAWCCKGKQLRKRLLALPRRVLNAYMFYQQ